MHAFTRQSKQLRDKVFATILRSLHHTPLYRHLILTANQNKAKTPTVYRKIHATICNVLRPIVNILKFLYGKIYNDKFEYHYGHARKDIRMMPPMP